MLSTIIDFVKNNPQFVITCCCAVVSLVVNIIISIKNHDASRLKEALLSISEVICQVEQISTATKLTAIQKKAMAETILFDRFGRVYSKNAKLFSDAIEDILTAPQKKGGKVDVSQKN